MKKYLWYIWILALTIVLVLYLYFIYLAWNINERVWQQVTCDYFDIPNKVVWEITYEEDDYIVVSWYNELWLWTTGHTIIYHDCEWCSIWVQRAEFVGWYDLYEKKYSETFILKKFECIRDNYKEKDLVSRVKILSK